MEFHIGTTNPNKVRELASLLDSCGHELKVSEPLSVEETEDDFEGNALLKARAYAKHTKALTISEDSGLIVEALGGLPGPFSAEFSKCEIDRVNWRVIKRTPHNIPREIIDKMNNQLVLELMKGVPEGQRDASFKVVLIVANPDGEVLFNESGGSKGYIAREEKGERGFGYDPIFIGADTFGLTYAELDSMRKNIKSHREDVVDKFRIWLKGWSGKV